MAVETRPVLEEDTAARRHRFTVEEYDRMGEAGIFGEDDHVELIEGDIYDPAAKTGADILCRARCLRLFTPHVGDDLWLVVQDPVRLGAGSKPEPDMLVCRLAADDNIGVPTAENTLIVVEVADSSLRYDRNVKLPLYARSGIPEAWLIDLANGRVERHTGPGQSGYRQIAVAHRGESLPSTILPDLTIAADAVLI
jgi:Uma2 family endonuclease